MAPHLEIRKMMRVVREKIFLLPNQLYFMGVHKHPQNKYMLRRGISLTIITFLSSKCDAMHHTYITNKKSMGPRPGFEPELRDPQSLMLPDYTTSAMQVVKDTIFTINPQYNFRIKNFSIKHATRWIDAAKVILIFNGTYEIQENRGIVVVLYLA